MRRAWMRFSTEQKNKEGSSVLELPFNLRKVKNIKQKPSRKINPARIYDKKGNKVFNHSLPSSSNREKIKIFRKRKKPRD